MKIDNSHIGLYIYRMEQKRIRIKELPKLEHPIFIAGFEGWGNALNISTGMADFLIKHLSATRFADLDQDTFYRYDGARPMVTIKEGVLKNYQPPNGIFYYAKTEPEAHDLIIFKGDEPNLCWEKFVDELLDLCEGLGVESIITLGSMYDNVLHTDRIISGIASGEELKSLLLQEGVNTISYQGPSSIHSIIHWEGRKRKLRCASLWCHCPYYVQGTTHFGLLSELAELLAYIGNFILDTTNLEKSWEKLDLEIKRLIENNSQLQTVVEDLKNERKKNRNMGRQALGRPVNKNGKIINFEDFLEPK